jgi:hypothetical protein
MEIAHQPPEIWPGSIRGINGLPAPLKHAIYRTLLVSWVCERYGIDPQTMTQGGKPVVTIACPENSRAMEMNVWHTPGAQDPLMYIHLVDTFNNQLLVLLVVINNPESPRFQVDQDVNGESTNLATRGRNLEAEIAAMHAGLAPCQIRFGLRNSRTLVPVFENFVSRMGHTMFLVEPLAYHNAITFETFGFSYLRGRREMERINQEFQPGGPLHARLDGSTPFRRPDVWQTVRGRSWAIHDGILGRPFTGIQMYKRIGVQADIQTFPGAIW